MKFIFLFVLFLSPLVLLSVEKDNLDKNLYIYCEDYDQKYLSAGKVYVDKYMLNENNKDYTCYQLLDFKAGYYDKNNFNISILNTDEGKQFHAGMNFSYYTFYGDDYEENYDDIKTILVSSFYFEYRIHLLFYLGSTLGTIDGNSGNTGIVFHPYLRFSPFFMLRYFDLGASAGFLTYYEDENYNNIFFTFDVYFGIKIANFFRLNLEFGVGSDDLSHIGIIMGVLF